MEGADGSQHNNSPKPKRVVTSVHLGALRTEAQRKSAESGQTISSWVRALVQRELGESGQIASIPTRRTSQRAVYRAWLESDLVDKLDQLAGERGLRTRAAALRAVLEGLTPAGGGVTLADAASALGASNHHLVAIGRNLNQVARSLNAYPGRTTTADRLALVQAEQQIRTHLEQASVLLGQLRPLLKPIRKTERAAA